MQLANLVVLLAIVPSSLALQPNCAACPGGISYTAQAFGYQPPVQAASSCPPSTIRGCSQCINNIKQIDYLLAIQATQDIVDVTRAFCNLDARQSDAIDAAGADFTASYEAAEGIYQSSVNLCISQTLDNAMADTITLTETLVEALLPALEAQVNTAILTIIAAFDTLGLETDTNIVVQLMDYPNSVFWQSVGTATSDLIAAMVVVSTSTVTDANNGFSIIFANATVDYTACINTASTTFANTVANSIITTRNRILAELATISSTVQSCLVPVIVAVTTRTVNGINLLLESCAGGLKTGTCA